MSAALAEKVETRLLTREAAANYLGMCMKAFERYVQKQLRHVEIRVGRRIYYAREDVESWVAKQKGIGSGTEPRGRTVGSRGRVSNMTSPSVLRTEAKLSKPPRVRTPMLYPVDSAQWQRDPGNSGT